MRTVLTAALVALPLLAAGCSSEDRRAGGTTAGEAKALEDAAQMLEDQQLAPGSVPSGAASPAPAASAAAPAPRAAPTG